MKKDTYLLIDLAVDNRFDEEEKASIYLSNREYFGKLTIKDMVSVYVARIIKDVLEEINEKKYDT